MRRIGATGAVVVVLLAVAGGGGAASAHGFGERYDLPIPLNLFLVGAAATVGLSFVVIGLFVRPRSRSFTYPTYNLLGNDVLRAVLANQFLLNAVRLVSVLLFLLIISTSLFGSENSIENFSPAFVWIIWWVGMGYLTALVGNLWILINPWRIIYDWVQRLLGGDPSRHETPMWTYPERLDRWPALVLFLLFAWLENVYNGSDDPFQLGVLVLEYSIITWAGMIAFGRHKWLSHGEVFTVLFGFFARFSPTEVRVAGTRSCRGCELDCETPGSDCVDCYACFDRADLRVRELNLRPYAVGLASPRKVTTATAAFVVLALAMVTFDGLTATSLWIDIQTAVFAPAEVFGQYAVDAIDTVGLLLLPLLFLLVYLGFSWAIRLLSGESGSVANVARTFVFSLVPIALAYNLAHFVSLIAIQGQLMIPLSSDPFGFGWDLFGTADYRLNISVVNAKFVWYVSVAAIVLGHIVSVYIAHVISVREMPNHAKALRSQYPMLVLMVMYTATSLWIIAQPIVGGA